MRPIPCRDKRRLYLSRLFPRWSADTERSPNFPPFSKISPCLFLVVSAEGEIGRRSNFNSNSPLLQPLVFVFGIRDKFYPHPGVSRESWPTSFARHELCTTPRRDGRRPFRFEKFIQDFRVDAVCINLPRERGRIVSQKR